jgi:anthranilate synthase component 2
VRLLIVDNYDSFTYNLYHYANQFIKDVEVKKNDEVDISKINDFDKIILSPGPGLPHEHKNLFKIIEASINKSLLGVCLGHQAIAEYFGASLTNLDYVNHGVSTEIKVVDFDCLFNNLPNKFNVGLYHSWFVSKKSFPKDLIITSENKLGNIYSFRHINYDIRGVQFHPESIMTENGLKMIENWIKFN